MFSSLPVFMGRPKPPAGAWFALAFLTWTAFPIMNPADCGPRWTLPPL